MNTIRPAGLEKLLSEQPGLQLLDVRTPVEYAEVHVRRAFNVPLDDLDPAKLHAVGSITKEIGRAHV